MDEERPPDVIEHALMELCLSAGLEGVAAIDRSDVQRGDVVLYQSGHGTDAVLGLARVLLGRAGAGPMHAMGRDLRPVMVCPWVLPPNRPGGLALWRSAGAPAWEPSDHVFAATVAGLIRVILEHSPDESGLDRLTGLPNRLYFLDEAERHIERLHLDRIPGTLILISMDRLDRLVAEHGREAGDWALTRVATLLRAMVRPADLVGRVATNQFAVWLNGMDHMTAAERAEILCERRLTLPESTAPGNVRVPSLSIGIASRTVGNEQDIRELLRRAAQAVAKVRDDGGGGWHVSRDGSPV